jgi:hypothetical protein
MLSTEFKVGSCFFAGTLERAFHSLLASVILEQNWFYFCGLKVNESILVLKVACLSLFWPLKIFFFFIFLDSSEFYNGFALVCFVLFLSFCFSYTLGL